MEFQTGQDKVANAPVSQDKLVELIETSYVAAGASPGEGSVKDKFLTKFLEQLVQHSSQYKYVISMTSLKGEANPKDYDVSMSNDIGAAWNSKKDGFYNYTLANNDEKFLVTVFWISK